MIMLRSFIAIPLPMALRRQLGSLQQELKAELPELKTGVAENLHLTLIFLGEQSEERLAKIGTFMLSVVGSQAPFSLHLQGLGCFPNKRRPRVVWLGVRPPEQLQLLQRELSVELAEAGVVFDNKPFRPHLTLGRLRKPPHNTKILQLQQSIAFEPFQVESVILYSSRLTPQGAVHTPLSVAELKSVATY